MRGSTIRSFGYGIVLAPALFLAACADQIDITIPGGQMLGLTGGKQTKPEDVPTRAPLVVPPTTQALPPPGPRQANIEEQAWPDDPDEQVKKAELERKRKLQEYYDKGDWSGKGGIEEFEKLMDAGARKPGIFGDGPVRDDYRNDKPETLP